MCSWRQACCDVAAASLDPPLSCCFQPESRGGGPAAPPLPAKVQCPWRWGEGPSEVRGLGSVSLPRPPGGSHGLGVGGGARPWASGGRGTEAPPGCPGQFLRDSPAHLPWPWSLMALNGDSGRGTLRSAASCRLGFLDTLQALLAAGLLSGGESTRGPPGQATQQNGHLQLDCPFCCPHPVPSEGTQFTFLNALPTQALGKALSSTLCRQGFCLLIDQPVESPRDLQKAPHP